MNVMEYDCAIRNDEQAHFRKTWKDLNELMLSEVSRTRTKMYTVTKTVTDFDRLSPSQQCKDLKQFQRTHDGKCYPHPEKELWSLNADKSRLFSLCFCLFFLMVFPFCSDSSFTT